MLKASFILATIPAAVFAVMAPAPKSQPVPVKQVQTEGVRMIPLDSQTFRARWRPLYDVPPAIEVRHATPDVSRSTAQDGVADTVARPAPQPRPRHRLTTKRASLNICERHGLRKVEVVRGKWRGWRCRK